MVAGSGIGQSTFLGFKYSLAGFGSPSSPGFPSFGILLDMVGAKDAIFTHEEISSYYAKNILNKVWKKAHRLGFGRYFVFQETKQILDDHYYINP